MSNAPRWPPTSPARFAPIGIDTLGSIREDLLAARVTNTTLRLAESLLDRPYVTAKRVTREFDVTAATAPKAIESLVDQDILTEVS